jgi:hypothetical protein
MKTLRLSILFPFFLWNVFATQVKQQLHFTVEATSADGDSFEFKFKHKDGNEEKVASATQVKQQLQFTVDTTSADGDSFEVTFKNKDGTEEKVASPRYFAMLSADAMEFEVQYYVQNGRWSDRVLLEILYFSLQHDHTSGGRVDLRSAQIKLSKWDIHRRTSDHCSWDGISCNQDKQVTQIRLDGLDFTGTLPDELRDLSSLEVLEMKRKYSQFHEQSSGIEA